MLGAFGELEGERQGLAAVAVGPRGGLLTSRPAHAGAVELTAPGAVVALGELVQRVLAEVPPRVEHDVDPRGPLPRDHTAQDHRPVGTRGQRERLAALDRRIVSDPAAAPDQAARLVVATPHAPVPRGHGVGARAADQGGEHRAGVPAREAHPDEVAARADEDSALTVGQQRVLAQDMRPFGVDGRLGLGRPAHRASRAVAATAAAAMPAAAPAMIGRCVAAHSCGLVVLA